MTTTSKIGILQGELISTSIKDLMSRVDRLEQRLAEIVPSEEQLKNFPALKDAYEKFLIVKALTSNDKI